MFIIVGIIIFIIAIIIKTKKRIGFISGLDISKIKKEKDKKEIADRYSNALIIASIAFVITELLKRFFGIVGTIIGLILIIIAASNLSVVSSDLKRKN